MKRKNNIKIRLSAAEAEFLEKQIKAAKDEIKELEREIGLDGTAKMGIEATEFQLAYQVLLTKKISLNNLVELLNKAEIIEDKQELNENVVNIGDIVAINLDNEDEFEIRLVAGLANLSADIQEITTNSPLGGAIYNKPIGEVNEYKVDGVSHTVVALAKRTLTETPEAPTMPTRK